MAQFRSAAWVVLVCVSVTLAVVGCLKEIWPLWDKLVPQCPFFVFTGLHCPGCGTWRAFNSFLQGNLAQAAGYNPVLFLAAPLVLAVLGERWAGLRWTVLDHSGRAFPPLSRVVLLVVLAYWILRNVPCFPFTLLAPGGPDLGRAESFQCASLALAQAKQSFPTAIAFKVSSQLP